MCLLQHSQGDLLSWQEAHSRWLITASRISLWLSDPSRIRGPVQQG